MVLREATEAGAAALHQARGHEGDWRQADCQCLPDALTVVQAAGAVLAADHERRLAQLEGRPPGVVPGAPPPAPGPEPPPPRPPRRDRDRRRR